MTHAERKPDENNSATQAEIERLRQELSRERDMHLRARACGTMSCPLPYTLGE